MFKSVLCKSIELFILFVVIPVLLVIKLPIKLKLTVGILGVIYVVLIAIFVEKFSLPKLTKPIWQRFLKSTGIKFLVIAIVLSFFVYKSTPEKLFYVVLEKPKTWLFFLGVYTIMSVIPQEFIYRTFFFNRYRSLVKSNYLFILINAGLFSLAHLFFGNTLVMIITFIGGLLFAYTYYKTKSTLFVMIEHTLYGCWLYTVGMGMMLGFPA